MPTLISLPRFLANATGRLPDRLLYFWTHLTHSLEVEDNEQNLSLIRYARESRDDGQRHSGMMLMLPLVADFKISD